MCGDIEKLNTYNNSTDIPIISAHQLFRNYYNVGVMFNDFFEPDMKGLALMFEICIR